MSRLRNFFGMQRSLATERPAFNARVHDELRAEMRLDRLGKSRVRSAAAVKREADRRSRERARVMAVAEQIRAELRL